MNKTVSIIIPCRNEEKYIKKCIDSILNSNYPKELIAIYVCDGLSDDQTRNIIKTLVHQNKNIHLIDNHEQTTPYALNLGLKASQDDVKIILGAHAEIDPNFISENITLLFSEEKIGCTGGVIENFYENKTAEIIGIAMASPFGVGNAHFRTGNKNGYVDTVAFGAYKKEVFEQIGYFDEELVRNQDDEFNYRLIKNGFKIYLSNKIKSKYYVRSSFSKLFKQYYQYGYWKMFVNKKHQTITTIRQIVPLFFVLFIFIGMITSFIHIFFFILFVSVIVLYLLMSLIFSFKLVKKKKTLFLTSFTFFILHFSYGLGYLKGIFDFTLFNRFPNKRNTQLSR
ncbi:MAG: glycosyltransferase family 2 protein [Vicingus serpentipes]|nr:glycosyltransferase family 2 protein [Vicingus serpentipes]